jgi:hypothetical protein
MKRTILLVCILPLAVSIRGQDKKQSQWDDYKPRTLQSLIEMFSDEPGRLPATKTDIVFPGDFPSQVKLVYLGKSRPLSTKKKELLTQWAKSRHPEGPQRIVELFPTEFLFQEGTVEHWVAVQRPLLTSIPKEVKRGQIFNAYVMLIGTIHKVGEQREWLFVMNEFDAP